MKKILIIDDEASILSILEEIFTDLKYKVLPYLSAKKALEEVDFSTIDCVITDILMPEMDGVSFVREMQKLNHFPKLFFVTGYSDYSLELLKNFRPVAIIFKPFDVDEVGGIISSHLK